MKFSDIPGHDVIKSQLRALVDTDRLPHALLLEGPTGIGKHALMRALAQYIHCSGRRPGDTDSCGACPSCLQHESMNHVDTYYSYPVVKMEGDRTPPTSLDYVEAWNKMLAGSMFLDPERWASMFDKKNAVPTYYVTESAELLRMLSLTAHHSRYKIVIMWLPERMGEEAANKLLKLLEEPHPDTLFLITSDTPALILPTIYSRLRRMEVRPLAPEQIAGYLAEVRGIDPQTALVAARQGEGSVVRAERTLEQGGADAQRLDMFMQLMRLAYQRKVAELRVWANDLAALGRENELAFYRYCQRMLRENFIYNFSTPQLVNLTASEEQFSRNFARFVNERNVMKMVEVIDDAMTDIAGNANGKIVNLDLAVKMILLLK